MNWIKDKIKKFCDSLKKYTRKRPSKNDYSLMAAWMKLQKEIWNNDISTFVNTLPTIKVFIRACQENNIYFESFIQNDAGDFINIFLDLLHHLICSDTLQYHPNPYMHP